MQPLPPNKQSPSNVPTHILLLLQFVPPSSASLYQGHPKYSPGTTIVALSAQCICVQLSCSQWMIISWDSEMPHSSCLAMKFSVTHIFAVVGFLGLFVWLGVIDLWCCFFFFWICFSLSRWRLCIGVVSRVAIYSEDTPHILTKDNFLSLQAWFSQNEWSCSNLSESLRESWVCLEESYKYKISRRMTLWVFGDESILYGCSQQEWLGVFEREFAKKSLFYYEWSDELYLWVFERERESVVIRVQSAWKTHSQKWWRSYDSYSDPQSFMNQNKLLSAT